MMGKEDMVYLARWDWMLVSIFTFIFKRKTSAGYVPVLKEYEKAKKIKQSKMTQRKDQEDNYKLVEGSVYSVGLGLTTFSKFD